MEWNEISTARALVYLTLLPAAGLPLYFVAAGRTADMIRPARRAAAAFSVLAGLAAVYWVLASVASMAGLSLGELDRDTVLAVVQATPLAAVLAIRLTALCLLVALVLPERIPPALPALAGLAALGTAAFTGHAGASEGAEGLVHRLFDIAHLAAAACWLGALLHFVSGAFGGEDADAFEKRLAGFARIGTVIVVVLLGSGIANLLLTAGWPVPLSSAWTRLLGLKLLLFLAMLGLAGINRWLLTPGLAAGVGRVRKLLRLSLTAELACGIGLVCLVALIGTLDPSGN